MWGVKGQKVTPGRRTEKAFERRWRWLLRQAIKDVLVDRFRWIMGHRGNSTAKLQK